MDVFIYASPGFGRPLDEVEDALEKYLGERGEVTGSGTGESGSNIDIEIFEEMKKESLLKGLRRVLAKLKVPLDSTIVIDGEEHRAFEGEAKA